MDSKDKTLKLEKIIQDLDDIFCRAMADKDWAVALKTRELLMKMLNIGEAKTYAGVKPLSEWTTEEIQSVISEAERLGKPSE